MNYTNTKSNGLALGSNVAKNTSRLDKLDILILAELLRKPDIRPSEISNKLKIPLSTIQRRRRRRAGIDRASMIKKIMQLIINKMALEEQIYLLTHPKEIVWTLQRK